MTGNKEYLSNIVYFKENKVTFGDGSKARIIGKGVLSTDYMPEMKNVLLVKGLKANLISISELCDEELHVEFNKEL